jgi:hypothetical protein
VEHGCIKSAAIPAHQLRLVALNGVEELTQALGLLLVRDPWGRSETSHPKALIVAKSTPNHPDTLKMMGEKVGLASIEPGLTGMSHPLRI